MPLDKPIPTTLARGVEMASRILLEKSSDGSVWKQLLDRVSDVSAHGSWRRTVLLAVTRSEHGAAAVHLADAYLVTADAKLLRELLRTGSRTSVQRVIGYDALRSLKRELRMYFVQFCHKTPALAAEVFAACQKTGSH